MNEYARCRAARLTLPVHIHALDGGCRGLFGVGIGEITIGFLPPSSRLTRLRSAAAALAVALPVGTDPTKPMRCLSCH